MVAGGLIPAQPLKNLKPMPLHDEGEEGIVMEEKPRVAGALR